jgi:urease accessory protein
MNIKVSPLFKNRKQQALLRLLQLTSPALPVGSYAYSQGLEWVVDATWIKDADSLEEWLKGLMHGSINSIDIPIMKHLYQAWLNNDIGMAQHWNAVLLAYRETSEVRKEELDRGHALANLLTSLNLSNATQLSADKELSFVTGYCCAAVEWQIDLFDAAMAYIWGWSENQVVSAMKIMPLGQSAGQTILNNLIEIIPVIVENGLQVSDEDIGSILPAQAIACAQHETQYARLFRS